MCPNRKGHLGPLTHSHAVHVALDDVERVPQVPFRYVEDDVSAVGGVRRRDGAEEDDLCKAEARHGKGRGVGPPTGNALGEPEPRVRDPGLEKAEGSPGSLGHSLAPLPTKGETEAWGDFFFFFGSSLRSWSLSAEVPGLRSNW